MAAGSLDATYGGVAQLVERLHGMQEVRGFEPHRLHLDKSLGFMLGGLIAGEGCFNIVVAHPPNRRDGSTRLRFVFSVHMASRDRSLLESLHDFLGIGSINDQPPRSERWLPSSRFSIGSRLGHRLVTIPFGDEFLLPCAKRDQFDRWKHAFEDYERRHPTRIGLGPSSCSEEGCDMPVRGRGLCRSHYYRATGY